MTLPARFIVGKVLIPSEEREKYPVLQGKYDHLNQYLNHKTHIKDEEMSCTGIKHLQWIIYYEWSVNG